MTTRHERVTRAGSTLLIYDTTDPDGRRTIEIADERMVLPDGAVVMYDPSRPQGQRIVCFFSSSWGEGAQIRDLPCVIAILSETYEQAMALARAYDEHVDTHPWGGRMVWHETARERQLHADSSAISRDPV